MDLENSPPVMKRTNVVRPHISNKKPRVEEEQEGGIGSHPSNENALSILEQVANECLIKRKMLLGRINSTKQFDLNKPLFFTEDRDALKNYRRHKQKCDPKKDLVLANLGRSTFTVLVVEELLPSLIRCRLFPSEYTILVDGKRQPSTEQSAEGERICYRILLKLFENSPIKFDGFWTPASSNMHDEFILANSELIDAINMGPKPQSIYSTPKPYCEPYYHNDIKITRRNIV